MIYIRKLEMGPFEETELDCLDFTCVADAVAEIIFQVESNVISIRHVGSRDILDNPANPPITGKAGSPGLVCESVCTLCRRFRAIALWSAV